MIACSLQSGSNGNCTYVETGDVRFLIDAGISGIQTEKRLRGLGRDIREVDFVLISHDHSDHVKCSGILSRKYNLDIFMTEKTCRRIEERGSCGRFGRIRHFRAGEKIRLGGTSIETVPTPHDCEDGVAFIIDDSRNRMGVLTDLGHVFAGLEEVVETLDGVILESNYDASMLENGPYPAFLKRRIEGNAGHISNTESAGLLAHGFSSRLRWACLAHLSGQNNSPATALATHRAVLGEGRKLSVAGRYEPSGVLSL